MTAISRIHDARLPGAPARPIDLVLDGPLIAEIRPSAARPVHDGVLDAAGAVVFPGLIDVHVHLAFSPDVSPEFELAQRTPDELAARLREHGRQHLAAGVTTVRDLGGPGSAIRRYARDVRAGGSGPRVFGAGAVLTRPMGHCHFVGDVVGADDGVDDLVDAHAAAGDPWVKIMVTGGALTSTSTPETLQFDLDTTRRVVERAHAHGLRVAAHALTGAGADVAVAAGVDSIEHGVGADAGTLERMAESGTFLVPVLSPSDLTLGRAHQDGEHVERLRRIVGALHSTVRESIRMGVGIAAGSDAGCPDVAHGASLLHELRLLERLGLPRGRVLAAATSGAADLLAEPRLGRIEVGAFADLLLLSSDPNEHLEALAGPVAVLSAGRLVPLTGTSGHLTMERNRDE